MFIPLLLLAGPALAVGPSQSSAAVNDGQMPSIAAATVSDVEAMLVCPYGDDLDVQLASKPSVRRLKMTQRCSQAPLVRFLWRSWWCDGACAGY